MNDIDVLTCNSLSLSLSHSFTTGTFRVKDKEHVLEGENKMACILLN